MFRLFYRDPADPCPCARKEGDSKHEVILHGDGVGAASLALQKAPQSAKATTPRDAGPRLRPRRAPSEPRGSSAARRPSWRGSGVGWEVSTESVQKAPRGCRRRRWVYWLGWVFVLFCWVGFFAGRTVIRRKEGWHPGRERAPSPGGAGRGSPAPAGKADRRGFGQPGLGIRSSQSRLHGEKSPGDGKHQTLATVMYREQHSLFTVWGWFVFFFLFFVFFVFVFLFLSRRLLWRCRRCHSPWGRGQRSPKSEPECGPPAAAFPSLDVS